MKEARNWLSIIEYSQLTGISVSTIRRRIKNERIEFQSIGGKYFIAHTKKAITQANGTEELMQRLEIEKLKKVISHQREEMEDLRMLVQLYEGSDRINSPSITSNELPPELPLM
ncbi:MAG: hypothetical protein KAG61_13525 [Bacteriovoracaceae bacterium]|nr:hypothetical protein [Bacteriovoracaceae bacterium]